MVCLKDSARPLDPPILGDFETQNFLTGNMQNLKFIVFDLDDTLFPEHQFVYSGFHAVGEWVLNRCGVFGFFDLAWSLFQAGQRRTIFNQTLKQLEVEYDAELISQMVQVYRQHNPKISLHPDADWAIDFFSSDRTIGMITNGFLETQQKKVRTLGIEQRINHILYCDTLGAEYWKPSFVPYQKMMELTGFQGKNCAYIGDHPAKDFIGAKQLGWTTVRICRDDGEYASMNVAVDQEAQYKIKSLYELKIILQQ